MTDGRQKGAVHACLCSLAAPSPLDTTPHSAPPTTLQSFSQKPTLVVAGREYETIKQDNLAGAMTRFLQSRKARCRQPCLKGLQVDAVTAVAMAAWVGAEVHARNPQAAPCHLCSCQAAGLVYGSETPPVVLSAPDGEREPALGRIEWGTDIRDIEVSSRACLLACLPAGR